jgi:anaerobic selenocysteine-containing dehydrogenase
MPYSGVSTAHRERLKYPMIRRNAKLERVFWDEAMSLIVEKTKDTQKRLTKVLAFKLLVSYFWRSIMCLPWLERQD